MGAATAHCSFDQIFSTRVGQQCHFKASHWLNLTTHFWELLPIKCLLDKRISRQSVNAHFKEKTQTTEFSLNPLKIYLTHASWIQATYNNSLTAKKDIASKCLKVLNVLKQMCLRKNYTCLSKICPLSHASQRDSLQYSRWCVQDHAQL